MEFDVLTGQVRQRLSLPETGETARVIRVTASRLDDRISAGATENLGAHQVAPGDLRQGADQHHVAETDETRRTRFPVVDAGGWLESRTQVQGSER